MRQRTVRIIAAVIALLLAGIMIFSALVDVLFYTKASAAGKSIGSLKKDLAAIAQEKKEINAEIASLQRQMASASQKKAAIDKQISATEDEIDTTNELISKLSSEIKIKTAELEAAEEKLALQDERFKKRARVMYENGETTYLEVLLNSGNFSQMLSRMEIVTQIMDYDNKLVGEYTAAKESVAQQKASLESDKTDEVTYKGQLQSKKVTLNAQLQESQELYDSLNENTEAKKAEAEKIEKEKDEIAAEIRRIAEEARRAAEAAAAAGKPVKDYSSQTFQFPVPGHTRISSPFGMRRHPVTGQYKLHSGTDFPAPKGTTVLAAKSGTVVKSQMTNAYGNYIIINHGGGMMTAYAHLSQRCVSVGDTVEKGQKIGCVGSTGWSTGPHLHFEVIINGSFVNPMNYFS